MHGTEVAALLVGQLGASGGGTGAATRATLVFTPLELGSRFDPGQVALALARQVGVDVASNSWGAARPFADNFRPMPRGMWAGRSLWRLMTAAVVLAIAGFCGGQRAHDGWGRKTGG